MLMVDVKLQWLSSRIWFGTLVAPKYFWLSTLKIEMSHKRRGKLIVTPTSIGAWNQVIVGRHDSLRISMAPSSSMSQAFWCDQSNFWQCKSCLTFKKKKVFRFFAFLLFWNLFFVSSQELDFLSCLLNYHHISYYMQLKFLYLVVWGFGGGGRENV